MQEKYTKTPKTADWNTFLQILAPQFIDRHTDLTISEENETISFEIDSIRVDEFKEHFYTVMRNAEFLDGQLSYKDMTVTSSGSSLAAEQFSESPKIQDLSQAKVFMEALFGMDTMNGSSACHINFNSYFVRYDGGVLLSNPQSFRSYQLAKNGQDFLCAHFNGVSVDTLRQIIATGNPPLPVPTDAIMDATEGQGFVQTCFGIVEDKTDPAKPTFQVYFDIGRFLQLVYPPQIHDEKISESKTRITMSLSHLLLYVKQLSRHGLLFTVELEHGRVNAHPLLLPHRERIAKSLSISILLDDSGSMRDYREKLFESVRSLIQRIAIVAPEAEIHLTVFSGSGQKREYKGKANQFNFDCFKQSSLNGSTALYDSITTPLETMQNRLRTHNNLLIIITDGRDNDSQIKEETILSKISAIQKAVSDGAAPPAIYALGCGEINENVLNGLARAAGRKQYIKTVHADDFNPIVANIEGFEYGRVMAEFTTQINSQKETHSLPICLNGQPFAVREVTIPLSAQPIEVSFKVPTEGQELALSQVTLQITRTQAQKFMEEYAQKIENIYAQPNISPAAKIARLNALGGEIDEFCKKAPQQIVLALATDLHRNINQYISVLRAQNDASAGSLPSDAVAAGLVERGSPILSSRFPTPVGIDSQVIADDKRSVSSAP